MGIRVAIGRAHTALAAGPVGVAEADIGGAAAAAARDRFSNTATVGMKE